LQQYQETVADAVLADGVAQTASRVRQDGNAQPVPRKPSLIGSPHPATLTIWENAAGVSGGKAVA
jgi:hypothetical protein